MNRSVIITGEITSPLTEQIQDDYFSAESTYGSSYQEASNDTYIRISNQERHIQNLQREAKEMEQEIEQLKKKNLEMDLSLAESRRQFADFVELIGNFLNTLEPERVQDVRSLDQITTRIASILYGNLRKGGAFPFSPALTRLQETGAFGHHMRILKQRKE